MKNIKHLIILFLFLNVLAACNNTEKTVTTINEKKSVEPSRVIAIGRVEPETRITSIGSEVNGVIQKIYAHAGDSVKKGQLLLEFKHDYEDARLVQANLKTETQNTEIKNVHVQINSAKIKAANLKSQYERLAHLLESNVGTKQNYDNAKADFEQAEKDVERLTVALQSAESKLNEVIADAKVSAIDIERWKIKAPSDGMVLTMDLTEGSAATTENALFDFAPNAPLTVLCEVDELWANKINLGQKAIIRTQGMDDNLAEGEVIFLSPYLKKKSLFSDDVSNMEDRRVREVRIRLNKNANLLINSRVEAIIDLGINK